MKDTVNILHISDLHFGMENVNQPTLNAQRKIALNSMLDALNRNKDSIDLIVISGDITWQGKKSGYDDARIWINKLLHQLNLTDNDVIVCAGNHDIIRNKTKGMGLPKDSNEADEWLKIEFLENFERPFENFIEYCKDSNITPLQIDQKEQYLIGYRNLKGIRFVVLNSSWFCRGNDDARKLWIGLPQLQVLEAEGKLDTNHEEITISVVHHPKEWFNESDQSTYNERPAGYRYLAERSDLILSGHTHGMLEFPSKTANRAYTIINGASYSGGNYRNNFSIIKIDPADKVAIQFSFEYDPRNSKWVNRDEYELFLNSVRRKEGSVDKSDEKEKNRLITNLIYRKHPNFIGREEELKYIKYFFGESLKKYQTISLVGMGGVGKTQLATEFAFNHDVDYRVIWWIGAENSSRILLEYEELCRQLGLTIIKDGEGILKVKETIFQWMMVHSNWLFVYDNAEEEQELLNYIPNKYKGDIIITSRNPNWRNILSINPLKVDFAKEFVMRSTGDLDEISITRLTKELGELPLALEQACAYIRETGISVNGYLERFVKHRKELFELGRALNSEQTVATTFDVSYQILEEQYPLSLFLLTICSFLSPDKISMRLFSSEGEVHPVIREMTSNILELDKNISILKKYSLLKTEEDEILIHRLIQLTIQDKLTNNKEEWLQTIIKFLFSQKDREEVLKHCLHLYQNYLFSSEVSSKEVFSLVRLVARHFFDLSMFTQAKEALQYAIKLSEKLFEEIDKERVETQFFYASIQLQLGQYDVARNIINKLLECHDSSPISKAKYLNSLLNIEKNCGNFQLASLYLEELNRLIEEHSNTFDELLLGGLYNSIGLYYTDIARYDKAIEYYSISLIINGKTNKYESALTLSNIGELNRALGNYRQARDYYNSAIIIYNEIFGDINPNTSNNLSNIGLSYYQEFNQKKAKQFLKKALEINKQVFQEPNTSSLRILNNYGMIEEYFGNYNEALNIYQESLNILNELTNEENQDHSTAYYNIGGVYQQLKDYGQAEEYIKIALELDMKIYNKNHPEVAKDYAKLGRLYLETKDYKKSSKNTEKSISIYKDNKLTYTNDNLIATGNYCISIYYEKKYYRAKTLMIELLNKIQVNGGESKKRIISWVWYPFIEAIFQCDRVKIERDFIELVSNKYNDLF
ncbi:MAG: tetratricopeptide repeat protein [Candidatus Pristimantibacillus sp.]